MREQYLCEMIISMAIGGLAAFVLALLVPGDNTIFEQLIFFVVYWVVGMFGVWMVIDFIEYVRRNKNVDSDDWNA